MNQVELLVCRILEIKKIANEDGLTNLDNEMMTKLLIGADQLLDWLKQRRADTLNQLARIRDECQRLALLLEVSIYPQNDSTSRLDETLNQAELELERLKEVLHFSNRFLRSEIYSIWN
jgi:hypothetical protein